MKVCFLFLYLPSLFLFLHAFNSASDNKAEFILNKTQYSEKEPEKQKEVQKKADNDTTPTEVVAPTPVESKKSKKSKSSDSNPWMQGITI